jgi:cytidine deaminase
MREMAIHELDPQVLELYNLACYVSSRAYAPYSDFRVGAAILTGQGGVFCGVNVENASYGLTCCAERNAIFTAIAVEGIMSIQYIAVYVEHKSAAPCGACRQVIAEFGKDAHIVFSAGDKVIVASLGELLPTHFASPNRI